jgi:hypothetical protein
MRASPLGTVITWPAVTNGVSPSTRFKTAARDGLTNGGRETVATWPGLTNGIFAVSPGTGEAVAECKMFALLLLLLVAAVVYRGSLLLARSLAVLIIFMLEGAAALSCNKNQFADPDRIEPWIFSRIRYGSKRTKSATLVKSRRFFVFPMMLAEEILRNT